jgi:hypothetical protein
MCLVCLKPAQDIDHVVNRGMGGSKERDVPENKVPLCRECHDLKTVGKIETRIKEGRSINEPWHLYYEWRRNIQGAPWISVPVEVSERYKCLVLSAAAESERSRAQAGSEVSATMGVAFDSSVPPVSTKGSAAAPSAGIIEPNTGALLPTPDKKASWPPEIQAPSTKEESDGADIPEAEGEVAAVHGGEAPQVEPYHGGDKRELRGGDDGGSSLVQKVPTNPDSLRGGELTHEQRVAIAQEIHDTEWNRQWFAGDTGNLWIEELGESAEQYLSDFGYQPESLANILRVCAAIPPAYRNGNLRFSHHVVVYDQPPEDRMRWLTECEEEQWSVAEFRRQVKGTKPRVKRYTVEQIEDYKRHHTNLEASHTIVGPCGYCPVIDELIRYLEEQE